MAIRMYEKAAILFTQAGQYNTARYLVENTCRIRQAHQWSISPSLQTLQQQSWYASAMPKSDNDWLRSQSLYAEYLLFGHTLRPKDAKNKNKSEAGCVPNERNAAHNAGSPYASGNHAPTDKETEEKRSFRGRLQKNAKGFGFVADVFIPERLLTDHHTGDQLAGTAVRQYDKKKAQWGWAALAIHPVP